MASAQKASISGSEVVLGPSAPVCFMRMPDGCPVEQAISRQRLRPGSGFLSVKVTTDGPTRVLQITDVKQRVSELSINKIHQPLEVLFRMTHVLSNDILLTYVSEVPAAGTTALLPWQNGRTKTTGGFCR